MTPPFGRPRMGAILRPLFGPEFPTMWIKNNNPATRRLKLPDMDEPVSFSENGKAQVSAEIGERLTTEVESIVASATDSADSEKKNESDSDSDADASADSAALGDSESNDSANTSE